MVLECVRVVKVLVFGFVIMFFLGRILEFMEKEILSCDCNCDEDV